VRHPQRHLSYAVSTILGLTAPALAAVLLTSSVASTASPLPAPVEASDILHGAPIAHADFVAPKPVVQVRPAVKHVVTVAQPTPVVHRVVHRTAPVVRRTTVKAVTATTSTTSQTAQPRGTNDYPYASQSDFYAMDKWGFTERQCVSFAAWRLAQHGHTINNRDHWGSAYSWDDTARRLGKTVTTRAHVGAIAQWNAHESGAYYSPGSATANGQFVAGGYGHVGYVKYVYADGSALVEQYNMSGSRSYSVMRVKAPRYLLIG
jgi:surface antigen